MVADKLGDEVAKSMTDAAIEGAFTAVTATDASTGPRELALALAKPGFGGSSKPNAEQAWEERGKQLREAWRHQQRLDGDQAVTTAQFGKE